jgi:hypothetical protein
MCVVPMTVLQGKNDLTVGVEVQGRPYHFDSGAEISLIQPYIGNQIVSHKHMVRRITGYLLRAEGSCEVQFKLGNWCAP